MISTKLTFLSPSSSESVRSLYEIHVEQSDVRIPTHFVLLLDTSGSMEQDNKLENVKKCVELLMNILNSNDKISVITFADDSKIILESVPADAVHKGSILQKVNSIQADGSTNLSASIVNLQKVIQNESMKIGVIVLTDGHANMGVHDTPTLTTMFRTIREKNPLLTMACLAYVTDNNAELCKAIIQ
jgi:Ca-activated chloride channel family protein